MRFVLASTVLAFMCVATSHAATLSTPLLATASDAVQCILTNVGTKPAKLESVQLIDQTGAVVSPLDANNCGPTLAPKQSCTLAKLGTPVDGFCEVKASGKLRLAIVAFNAGVATAALNGTK